MTEDERIEQFRKMAKANPDDDLAHFALGQALHDAGRHAEAAVVLKHVLKLNDGYSKAYVLLGGSLDAVGDPDGAVEVWLRGHEAAAQRGDLSLVVETENLLRARGVEPPRPESAPAPAVDDREPGPGEVRDRRSGRIGARLKFDPFGDEVGAYIQENVSQESWDAWMEMSIKVINELRLDLGDPEGQRLYDLHMRDFLRLPPELFEGKEYE
jgi:Fe-S cluster biosynthesis and repair protein YggX